MNNMAVCHPTIYRLSTSLRSLKSSRSSKYPVCITVQPRAIELNKYPLHAEFPSCRIPYSECLLYLQLYRLHSRSTWHLVAFRWKLLNLISAFLKIKFKSFHWGLLHIRWSEDVGFTANKSFMVKLGFPRELKWRKTNSTIPWWSEISSHSHNWSSPRI